MSLSIWELFDRIKQTHTRTIDYLAALFERQTHPLEVGISTTSSCFNSVQGG